MTSKIVCLRYAETIAKQKEEISRLTSEVDELNWQAVGLRSENSRLRRLEKYCLEHHEDMTKELEALKETHTQLKRAHSRTTKEIGLKEEKIEVLQSSLKEAVEDYRGSFAHQR